MTTPSIASTLASMAVKRQGGNRIGQDKAAIYAAELVLDKQSGATAVENGYREGMGLTPLTH